MGRGDRHGVGEIAGGRETWPDYSVRVSTRARRVRLVMTADHGLEVVVPRGFSLRKIPGLLESKKEWIQRAAARVEARRRRLEADPPRLPERIGLAAVDEEWEVEYRREGAAAAWRTGRAADQAGAVLRSRAAGRAGAAARERAGRLVVTGDVDDFDACKQALCRWLSRKAHRTLVPRLAEISHQHGLEYRQVSVRQQRTRWGSCSRRKTISLNARLLLLPAAAVDYVLIHELCHTLQMNHSPRFWALVEAHDPEYLVHRKLLRRATVELPTWLDHEMREPGV